MGSSSTYVRAYSNLPFYNLSVVFKAKLSFYKPVAGNTQAAFLTCSKSDVCAAVAFTAVSSFRICGDTCSFYLNRSVIAKGFTKEPVKKIKQIRHLFIL